MLSQHVRLTAVHKLLFPFSEGAKRREALYDRLYALHWGDTTTNNYGFAPATTDTRSASNCRCIESFLIF